ncbi:MAG: hypothetical protein AAGF83_15070 [Cyanobacteria bacterium P01_G01_bin.67]
MIDRVAGKVLAYVFGCRKDEVFLKLKKLLQPFGIDGILNLILPKSKEIKITVMKVDLLDEAAK